MNAVARTMYTIQNIAVGLTLIAVFIKRLNNTQLKFPEWITEVKYHDREVEIFIKNRVFNT